MLVTEEKTKVLVITGPTATGKSALAFELCREFDGELINADSVQVYKGFDIGSAKPSSEELNQVPNHLFSHLEPNQEFNAAIFVSLVTNKIEEIVSRGKLPILVGGTGLYINALLSGFFSESGVQEKRYDALVFVMSAEREVLYQRINHRVLEMHQSGLVDEVRELVQHYGSKIKPLLAIGYAEVLPFLAGEISEEEMLENIQKESRRYAKRQFTWWRNQPKKFFWREFEVQKPKLDLIDEFLSRRGVFQESDIYYGYLNI